MIKLNKVITKKDFDILRTEYLKEKTLHDELTQIENAVQNKVLKENVFMMDKEWLEKGRTEQRILKSDMSYLIDNNTVNEYYKLVHESLSKILKDKFSLILPEGYNINYFNFDRMLELENAFLKIGLYYFKQFNNQLNIEWILRDCYKLNMRKANLDMLINLEQTIKELRY